MRIRVLLLLLTALLALCGQREFAQTPAVPAKAESKAEAKTAPEPELSRCSFPLTWMRSVSGHGPPVVEVVLNHQVHATFMMDTGSADTIITQSTAKQLGLKPQIFKNESGSPAHFDKKRPLEYVHVDSLAINPDDKGVTGRLDTPIDLVVLSGKSLFPGGSQRIDGILGMNLLSYCTLFIDPQSQWVTLWSPRALTAEERSQAGMGDAVEALLVDRGDKVLQVQAQISSAASGAAVLLNVDTGAESTTIPASTADQLKLEPNGPGYDVGTLYGHGHVMEAYARRMAIGGVVRYEQLVSYGSKALPVNQALGMDILSRYRVMIDPAGKKMYLKPVLSAAPAVPETPGKGGKP